ncbi:MAG TPA: ABC transporter transmembrane domain-containing protein, partial [Candidatus Angelobacter sp.]|nr:ABC transporter transmembrane domain-containing protein [Candidatus Angelobacter sp.]
MQKKPYTLGDITRKFLPFFRPYVKKYVGAILLLIATSLLGLVPPLLFKQMIDNGIKAGNVRIVTLMALLLLLVALLTQITRWCMEYIHEWVSARFVADIRDYLFTH